MVHSTGNKLEHNTRLLNVKPIIPQAVDVSVHHDLCEWDEECEDEPDIDHLDLGCLGQGV